MRSPARIDVHQHVVPPFWAEALPLHGGDPSGWKTPDWSPDAAIEFMDSLGIATGILSLTAPGIVGWHDEERRTMARRVNDYTAGLVAERPDRFGNFATLPLPDIDGALRELARAIEDLGADGVVLFSNYDGTYLGDPSLAPLWAELARRDVVVFVHPTKPDIPIINGMPGPMIDYPFDTTRTAVHMVLGGVFERHPDLRIILSHAGGFLPYAAERFAQIGALLDPERPASAILGDFRRFHVDTALSASAPTIAGLLAFTPRSQILFGSDFPYAPAALGKTFTAMLDAAPGLSEQDRAAISRGNAGSLFARLT